MASDQQLYEMKTSGKRIVDIARELSLSPDGVRGRISRHKAKLKTETPPVKGAQYPDLPTYVYTGIYNPAAAPLFTGEWHLDFDELAIIGDLHAVATNRALVEGMCATSKRHMKKKRNLLICGDALDGSKDSKHPKHVTPISRAQELRFTKQLMDYLLETFHTIWLTPGNHLRNRMIELMEGDLDGDQLKALIISKPQRLEYSPYDVVHVRSGGEDWTITHQYQYSRRKLTVANQLAQKYQTHIVTLHQHHTAMGMDDYGRYVCIDCGGGHDDRMFSYSNLVPNTMPRMNRGWVLLKNGTANLITPYAAWGDFTRYVA